MTCEDVQVLFSEYYDNETKQASTIAMHLEGCPNCSQSYEEYRLFLSDIANIDEFDVPSGFHASLISHVDGFIKGRSKHISIKSHRFFGAVSSAAAAAVVVLVVWYTGVFDTGTHENHQWAAEFHAPQAAAGVFAHDDFDEVLTRHIPEAGFISGDSLPFPDPLLIEVGYLGSPVTVIRPHFATAMVFLIIGLILGFNIHRLTKYIERKKNNAL